MLCLELQAASKVNSSLALLFSPLEDLCMHCFLIYAPTTDNENWRYSTDVYGFFRTNLVSHIIYELALASSSLLLLYGLQGQCKHWGVCCLCYLYCRLWSLRAERRNLEKRMKGFGPQLFILFHHKKPPKHLNSNILLNLTEIINLKNSAAQVGHFRKFTTFIL